MGISYLCLLLAFFIALPAQADLIPPSRSAFALELPGGIGQDMARARVLADEEELRNGGFFFRFSIARGNSRIVLNETSHRAFEIFCAQNGGGAHLMSISWQVSGYCRWKPENWHKPENLPFEYDPRFDARAFRRISTHYEP